MEEISKSQHEISSPCQPTRPQISSASLCPSRDCQLYNMCRGLLVWRVFVTFIIRRSREVQSVTPNLKDNALSPFGFSILFNRKIKFTFTFTIGRHCQSWSSLSPPLQSNSNFRLELQQQEVKARSDNFESQFWKNSEKTASFHHIFLIESSFDLYQTQVGSYSLRMSVTN